MTTTQLNADILRNLGIIANDESKLNRVAKYLRRMVKELSNDPSEMTKEEFFARVDEAMEQARQGKVYRMQPGETLDEFLERVG